MLAPAPTSTDPRRFWLRWIPTFLGFPVGGLLASTIAGPVDGALPALAGGALTGAILGAGQALATRGAFPMLRWAGATVFGLGLGLAVGATAVGYGTSGAQLAVMGALTGLGVGLSQALVLRGHVSRSWRWALANPPLWALGWTVTWALGIDVERQYTVFGASGALVYTILAGVLLRWLLGAPRKQREATAKVGVGAGQ